VKERRLVPSQTPSALMSHHPIRHHSLLFGKLRNIQQLLQHQHKRTQLPCFNKAKTSTTPKNRWFKLLKEFVHSKSEMKERLVLDDLEMLLTNVQEKRRLTIDWRGTGGMTNNELIKQTAKRVGLIPPRLPGSDDN
jgi:hypothetical protein